MAGWILDQTQSWELVFAVITLHYAARRLYEVDVKMRFLLDLTLFQVDVRVEPVFYEVVGAAVFFTLSGETPLEEDSLGVSKKDALR